MDLLKAAGINEVPTTIDEFYDCLVTLKEYYGDEYVILAGPFKPNSEGNENWVIPKTIACAFGIYNDWMVDENGQVYYMTEAPGFPDMIAFLTKLYNEGLIDPDWAINTESTLKEKFTSGKAIITCGNRALADFCSAALIENLNLSWDDLGYISALKGSDGTCKYQSTEPIRLDLLTYQTPLKIWRCWLTGGIFKGKGSAVITFGEEGDPLQYG